MIALNITDKLDGKLSGCEGNVWCIRDLYPVCVWGLLIVED